GTGIAFHPNQEESFYVNSKDHVRIVSFKPGLNFKSVCNRAFDLDHSFQDSLQFAATNNFGYLTSSFYDVGSGMKLSFYAHLPSITFLGEIENIIQSIRERGLAIRAVHGVGGKWGDALGAYYEVSTISSFQGNELDQRATIESAAKFITKTERKFRKQCAENRTTEVTNIILRSLSKGRFSLLLTLREAIDIISALKWGIDLKFGDGIDGSEIRTLIYHMQETHMQVLATTGSCKFEDDIKDNMNLQKDRLRAIVMQQTCEKIQFGE
ncbi:MAG: hypothetical protein IKI31_00910, partial [Treponema sp.]|nr:hypothetical protein [Treponema sp.]